ncbi:unnamed protein product [Pleuronectes platessa]|uniref:Uncharacterized protein n=1 Tax=Pleuronectes platessa TaxID=8262 RepID=A0A9N7Y5X2_PLEPL|nr:unnamed protein product [Pleuronectes platessa]
MYSDGKPLWLVAGGDPAGEVTCESVAGLRGDIAVLRAFSERPQCIRQPVLLLLLFITLKQDPWWAFTVPRVPLGPACLRAPLAKRAGAFVAAGEVKTCEGLMIYAEALPVAVSSTGTQTPAAFTVTDLCRCLKSALLPGP